MITSMDRLKMNDSVDKMSFLDHRYFLFAIFISLAFHVIVVFGFTNLNFLDDIEFWLLLFVDTISIAVILLPIIASIDRKVTWHDPILWMAVIYLGMSGAFFTAFLIDQQYVFYITSIFGYSDIINLSLQDFTLLIIKAEILLLIFFIIVFYQNREPIPLSPINITALEKRAAFVTFLILFGGGFLILLGNLSLASFVDSITVDIGSIQVKQPELGTARYEIMADIGYISMTLGIISILSYTYPKSRFWSSILLLSAALFTILFTIESGSRIGVVFTVVQYILLALWFGYKPNRNFIVLGILLTLVILGSITVIRGNRFLERNSTGILTQIITGEARHTYFSSVSSPVAPLLALDRVRIMAIILKYLEGKENYVHGELIVAGIGNLITELTSRIGLIGSEQKTELNWANEMIRRWLFYDIVPVGSLPPSLPGEFYMQWGWWSFIPMSVLFGWVLLLLRRKLSSSVTLLSRWLILIVVLRLISIIPTEISASASMVMYITPIVLVYLFMIVLFNKIQSPSFS